MRFLLGTLVLTVGLLAQTRTASPDPVRAVVGRLELERYKAHIKGLAQFGDRMQGSKVTAMQSTGLRENCLALGTPTSSGIGSFRAAGP
jgi:hypothetical protein